MKKRLLVGISFYIGLTAMVCANSRVTVYSPASPHTITLEGTKDLAELVMRPELFGQTWWFGTVIAEKQATKTVINQKKRLLAQLSALAEYYRQDNNNDLAHSVEQVHQQLSALEITGRQRVPLDPDWIRLHEEDNHPLMGDYSLYTLQRPHSIRVMGLVTQPDKQPFRVGGSVSAYLKTYDRLPGAERDTAWLILPNGHTEQVPVAYWNRRHHETTPGSIIFVGFASLPTAYSDVNHQIVSLLTHRIPD